MAYLVGIERPEARGIRREHLIAHNNLAVLVKTELELRIRNDDALGKRIVGALLVKRDRVVAKLRRVLEALARELLLEVLDGLLEGNVLIVVADLRLRGRCVDGLRQLFRFLQALGKLDAAHGAVLAVALPAGAGDVAANDALHREHRELLHKHAVAFETGLPEILRHILRIHRNHVVLHDVLRIIEPEFRHLGKHGTLLRNRVVENHIKAADAVRRNQNHVLTDVINLSDFSFLYRTKLFHFTGSFRFSFDISITLRSHRNVPDVTADLFLDVLHILLCSLRQILPLADAADITLPAVHVGDYRLAGFQRCREREVIDNLAVQFVVRTNRNLVHVAHDVHLRKGDVRSSLAFNAVARRNNINRADSSRTAGLCTVLAAGLTKLLCLRTEPLAHERPLADARRVSLHNADHLINLRGRKSRTDRGKCRYRVRRSRVRIDAVIKVAQRTELCLEKDALARLRSLLQNLAGVADERTEDLAVLVKPSLKLLVRDRRSAVHARER